MLSKRTVIVALVSSLSTLVIASSAFGYSKTDVASTVVFHGIGPAGFKIDGKTPDVLVKEDDKTLTVVVPLKEITTGIAMRDKHMREKYLEVEKFPETKLDVDKASLNAAGDKKAKGKLTLHGVTKDMSFAYQVSCTGDVCNITGQIPINMNDFGIVIPVYLGVTMKPDVTVEISFQVKK